MSREELLWDHTGEELDDPLIGSYGTEEEEGVRYRYDHLLPDSVIDCMSMKNTACLDIYTSKMATEIQQGLKSALSQCPNFRVIINLKIVHIHKNNKQKFLS